MKYVMLRDAMEFEGHKLRRIMAMEDSILQKVHAGDIGGWIESEANLSQDGMCWVAEDAKVFGKAVVRDAARVTGSSIVKDDSWVGGQSIVGGHTVVSGKSIISGKAFVFKSITLVNSVLVGDYNSGWADQW